MQPLSRVNPKALISFGNNAQMAERPMIAVKISQCIAEWADIESMLGIFLGLLLDADTETALAMFNKVENRSSQMKMLAAAAETKMTPAEFDIFTILFSKVIRPAMRQRDKLAHWCWGYSPTLPNALLLTPPHDKMLTHIKAVMPPKLAQFDLTQVFVVTEADLERTFQRLERAKAYLADMMGAIWKSQTPELRESSLRSLSSKPEIQKELEALAVRNKNPESPQPLPQVSDDVTS